MKREAEGKNSQIPLQFVRLSPSPSSSRHVTSHMEVSGTVLRQVTYVSGAGTHVAHYRGVVPRGGVRVRMVMGSGFRDEGHLQYYDDRKNREPVLSTKKKLKLLKDLSKGVSSFPQLGFSLDSDQRALLDHLQRNLTTDGGEVLLRELEKVKAEKKEMKKRRKEEKKAKLKGSKKKTVADCESSSSSSSSESESSDSDCGEVVDMNTFKAGVAVATKPVVELELQPPASQSTMLSAPPLLPQTTTQHNHPMDLCSTTDASVVGFINEANVVNPAAQKRIEVCMGNKCKRSGAVALMQEFEKVVGVEGGAAVVGCKCMGKCKSAPNVRIQNSVAEGLDDSVKIPSSPLCIGVGFADVNAIVARFLGENHNHNDMGMAAATT